MIILTRDSTHFYKDWPSLDTLQNDILVILASNPWSMIDEVLVKWAASIDGRRIYAHIIENIQGSQAREQLILTLAALLCYQRLLTPTLDTKPIKGSYQRDFNAMLNGERLSNERTVSERMVLSVLRVLDTVEDSEKMRTFLATVLDTDTPVLEPSHESSDQYWKYRMEDGVTHKDAFSMVTEKTAAATSGEKEMDTMDDGEMMDMDMSDEEMGMMDDGEMTDTDLMIKGLKLEIRVKV